MKPIRILIADDHALVRDGIRAMMDKTEDIDVVAEASDGLEAIEKISKHKPNLVLLDIGMKSLNGLDAAARITREFPSIHVVILSMHANEEYVLRALRAGAVGYLLKDSKKQELLMAIHSVMQGKTYLSPQVSRHVIDNYVRSVGAEKSPLEQLTPRQQEILKLVSEGRSNKEIAQLLNVSVKTVDTHRTQLMQRLNIHDVAGLVRFAIKAGLISLDN
ncbi:response regulator transcription factor [bacterium]|nr:response regulator transcription factor [bacterium]MCI0603850.1 response regulator transcription factor [bacterium]